MVTIMDITYKWTISGVDGTLDTPEGFSNVALAIHWSCSGFLTDHPSVGNSRNGFVVLERPTAGADFIPYENLTEEIVLSWLFSKLDKNKVEQDIATSLEYADDLLAIENKSPLGLHWSPNMPAIPPDPEPPIIPTPTI